MKRYILKTTIFITIVFISIACLWLLTISQRKYFCNTDAHILVCGNSTVEYGVDDNILPNSLTIGLNAENPEFIYAKIKLLKKYNPTLDTVLIAIDDALLQKNIAKSFTSEINHFYYYDMFDAEDILFLAKNTSIDWLESYISRPFTPQRMSVIASRHFKNNTDQINFKDLGIGGYYPLDRHELQNELKNNQKGNNQKTITKIKDDKLAKYFIGKTIDFCNKNGINVIFFTTPKHSIAQTFGYRIFHKEYFPEIRLMDFTEYALPDSCYGDCYHINTEGAQIFTKILKDNL